MSSAEERRPRRGGHRVRHTSTELGPSQRPSLAQRVESNGRWLI